MTEYRGLGDPFNRETNEPVQEKRNRWDIIAEILFLVVVAALAIGVGQ
jgi:hypothetical protein